MRHLLYAKSKADVLVASLTADEHITKGELSGRTCRRICARSISPRSRWSTTSSSTERRRRSRTSRIIQPDYFAKGYEYTADGLQPKTAEEVDGRRGLRRRDHLHAGRHRLFVVALIELAPPAIAAEKLHDPDGARGIDLRRPARALDEHARASACTSSATRSSTATPTAR